jgi:hypothetical protein
MPVVSAMFQSGLFPPLWVTTVFRTDATEFAASEFREGVSTMKAFVKGTPPQKISGAKNPSDTKTWQPGDPV